MSAAKHDTRQHRGPATKPPRPLSPVAYAQPQDLEDLVWFLRSVRDEIDGGRVEDDLMVAVADRLVHRRDGVALIVRGPYGVEASLGMEFDQPTFSRAFHLSVCWNLVAPEMRQSTGHARSMLLQARAFADSIGLPLLIEEYGQDLEGGKAKLVARHISPVGTLFMHRPPQPVEAA